MSIEILLIAWLSTLTVLFGVMCFYLYKTLKNTIILYKMRKNDEHMIDVISDVLLSVVYHDACMDQMAKDEGEDNGREDV